jgi:hypothetical protein
MNGGASGNLAVPASYVGRPVKIDTGELASPQPAEVDDVRDREGVTSGVLSFSQEAFENRENSLRFPFDTSGEKLRMLRAIPCRPSALVGQNGLIV